MSTRLHNDVKSRVVVEGMYKGFSDNREFNTEDIKEAVSASVPLSTTMAEEIGALRSWAQERARMATE